MQGPCERDLCRLGELEARLAQGYVLRLQDAAVTVEDVEPGRQLGRVAGQVLWLEALDAGGRESEAIPL